MDRPEGRRPTWLKFIPENAQPAHMKLFDVAISRQADGGASVALSGELDLSTLDQLEAALDGGLGPKTGLVVLDLRALSFLDSSGLRAILALDADVRGRGGRVVLVQGPRRVHRVLELTRADEELEIVSDPAEIEPKQDLSAETG
jgi:anti-anti-sigma factor